MYFPRGELLRPGSQG